MKKHADSIDAAILGRFRSGKKGRVYAPADFLDLGSRATVDQALLRNCRAGRIRKIARGLYDVPKKHPVLGTLTASTEAVVLAVARRSGLRLQASGARAANALGLSDQVPLRTVYYSDGRRRSIKIGNASILLKPAGTRTMAAAGTVSGDVIQALRWVGRRNVDADTIARLKRNLRRSDKAQLLKDLRFAPAWVADVMRQVAQSAKKKIHG